MWPFNRQKSSDDRIVAPEVQDYYKADRRERVGVAWMVGIGTLIFTVALASALFFGGRWIYRQVTDNNENAPAQTVDTPTDSEQQGDAAPQPDPGPAPSQTPAPAPSPQPAPNPQPTPATTPTQRPVTGDNQQMPDTGPGSLLGVFVVSTLLSAALHHRFIANRS